MRESFNFLANIETAGGVDAKPKTGSSTPVEQVVNEGLQEIDEPLKALQRDVNHEVCSLYNDVFSRSYTSTV